MYKHLLLSFILTTPLLAMQPGFLIKESAAKSREKPPETSQKEKEPAESTEKPQQNSQEVAESVPALLDRPLSTVARTVIESPLTDDFFKLLTEIEQQDHTYQELLKYELVAQKFFELFPLETGRNFYEFSKTIKQVAVADRGNQYIALTDENNLIYCSLDSQKAVNDALEDLQLANEKIIQFAWNGDAIIIVYENKCSSRKITYSPDGIRFSGKTIRLHEGTMLGCSGGFLVIFENSPKGKLLQIKNCEEDGDDVPWTDVGTYQEITCYAVNPTGEKVLVSSGDKNVVVVDIAGHKEKILTLPFAIMHMAISADGTLGIIQTAERIFIVHLESAAIVDRIHYKESKITAFCLSSCNQYILLGFESGLAAVYEIKSKRRQKLHRHDKPVTLVSWGHNTLLSVSEDGKIYIARFSERLQELSLREILLLTKSLHLSFHVIYQYPYFKKIADETVKSSAQGFSTSTKIMEFLKEHCKSCPCNQARATCETDCRHSVCECCLLNAIKNKKPCPGLLNDGSQCKHIIQEFLSYFSGKHTVSYKAIVK